VPRDYPVDAALARHLIDQLIDGEFDIAASAAAPEGEGEGHAIGFVHKRIMQDVVPIVPVCINTYYPPNQPTPRRCYKLGQAIRAAVESYPADIRVGIAGSGGLSHFVVDEALDRGFIDLLRNKDAAGIQALAAGETQFGQLRDPQLDLRRRRGRAPLARMVAVRAGLPHSRRHRHRPRFCLLVVKG
jgi:3-O-methylgallate 3,4-dioxygenase